MTISSRNDGAVRVALIGYGLAGRVFHAPLVAATPGMVLSAIVTSDPEKQSAAQGLYPGAAVYRDVQSLFADADKFDLVVIASPNNSHFGLAKTALEKGLAVVVDKPMATTFAECQELLRAANTYNALLSVFHNRRWDNDLLTIKDLIASGVLGKVTRFESRFERWRPQIRAGHWRESGGPEDAGGLLFDLCSHLIDQAMFLFGKPVSIYGELDMRRPGARVDDDAFVALTFDGGVRAHLWASAIACSGGPRFQIFGTKGTFRKYGLDPQEDALRAGQVPGKDWGVEPKSAHGILYTGDSEVTETVVPSLPGNYPAFYAQMRDAIKSGAPLPVDPAEAAEVIGVIETVRKSVCLV